MSEYLFPLFYLLGGVVLGILIRGWWDSRHGVPVVTLPPVSHVIERPSQMLSLDTRTLPTVRVAEYKIEPPVLDIREMQAEHDRRVNLAIVERHLSPMKPVKRQGNNLN